MKKIIVATYIGGVFLSCGIKTNSNQEMIQLLQDIHQKNARPQNAFASEAKLVLYDSLLTHTQNESDRRVAAFYKGKTLLELGEEKRSIEALESLLKDAQHAGERDMILKGLAIAYMRVGERTNCVYDHSGSSCVFPIQGAGIHRNKTGSLKAISLYEQLLENNVNDLESRWLLNIAYMTLGSYPQGVPQKFLLPGLDTDTSSLVQPFEDVAVNVGLNTTNFAGGNMIEDFNNDGYLDIVTSGWDLNAHMHYCRNNGDGTFTDMSVVSGLKYLTGGLNMVQTDYNNDGLKDIFVLRGAWKREFGAEPNSLLRNNGDDTFTDVTKESGLLSFHPTQTATWADFNNDGWLDVFIGNESSFMEFYHPCELYINNQDGTFTEIASNANAAVVGFVKGVNSGDYNNDGWADIFISTLDGMKFLLRNDGLKNGIVHFTDVSIQAGLRDNNSPTFSTWFWDYDNDGWLDILLCNYGFRSSLAAYTAAEVLDLPGKNKAGRPLLYRNNHDGTFSNVSEEKGLNKVAFAMGANFGDIDNDGYSDMYLGTGNPDYTSLVPNKMFKNIGGQTFADVTTSARVGNLQKGHGVSFADLDNDGDLDIYIEVGGAYKGDMYQNALYVNPGQTTNNWIDINLEGVQSNRAAIGAKIKVQFKENGVSRMVYKEVNSGGSFGANPLRQHIGIGSATNVEYIEIVWPGINKNQRFHNVNANQFIRIKEGEESLQSYTLKSFDFRLVSSALIECGPQ